MYNVEVLGVHSPLLLVDVLVLGLYFSFVLSERQRKRENVCTMCLFVYVGTHIPCTSVEVRGQLGVLFI